MNGFVESKIAENDNLLSQITNNLKNFSVSNQSSIKMFPNKSENQSELTSDNWKLSKSIADTHKRFNETSEKLKFAKYSNNEMEALKRSIKNNEYVENYLKNKYSEEDVGNKTKIISINNDEFKEKQILVNRLIYVINFILFCMGLGILLFLQVISFRTLGILFILGFLLLLYTLFTSGPFLQAYGETSISIAKGITKDVIKAAAPMKECPEKCVIDKKKYRIPNM